MTEYEERAEPDVETLTNHEPAENVELNPKNGVNDHVDILVGIADDPRRTSAPIMDAYMDLIHELGYRVADIDPFPSAENVRVELLLAHTDREHEPR